MERPCWWALCLTCWSLSGSLVPLYHLSDRCVVTFSTEKAGVLWSIGSCCCWASCAQFAHWDLFCEVVPCGGVRNEPRWDRGSFALRMDKAVKWEAQGWRRWLESPQRRELKVSCMQQTRWPQDVKILPLLRFAWQLLFFLAASTAGVLPYRCGLHLMGNGGGGSCRNGSPLSGDLCLVPCEEATVEVLAQWQHPAAHGPGMLSATL